jgi:hypothetical protein
MAEAGVAGNVFLQNSEMTIHETGRTIGERIRNLLPF